VLVYSVASHVPFPVLFKVDRHSGSCDIINMDWLLTPVVEEHAQALTSNKQGGAALETLLKNMASRQTRRQGFGVRLFVQACVLAGCDYAPSRLNGVGLVNAFKLVRDNAYRNHANRFEKMLASLPRKLRAEINVDEYETLLAKSEAVFYYHLVRHADGTVKPINKLRFSDKKNGEIEQFEDHFPFLNRFDEEISFLGDMEAPPPISELIIPQEVIFAPKLLSPAKKAHNVLMMTKKRPLPQPESKITNPYRKQKLAPMAERCPLAVLDPNLDNHQARRENPFSQFSRKTENPVSSKSITEPRASGCDMRKYFLDQQQDVRFVKRHFPSVPRPVMESMRSITPTPPLKSHEDRAIFPHSTRCQPSLEASSQSETDIQFSSVENLQSGATNVNGFHSDANTPEENEFDHGQDDDALRPGSFETNEAYLMGASRLSAFLPGTESLSGSEIHDHAFHSSPGAVSNTTSSRAATFHSVPNMTQRHFSLVDLTDSNSGHGGSHSDEPAGSLDISILETAHTGDFASINQGPIANPQPRQVGPTMQLVDTLDRLPVEDSVSPEGSFKGGLVENLGSPERFSHLDLERSNVGVSIRRAPMASENTDIPTKSKYFKKPSHRRVTLDSSDRLQLEENCMTGFTINASPENTHNKEPPASFVYDESIDQTSPASERSGWDCEDQIESPAAARRDEQFYSHYCTNPFKPSTAKSIPGTRGIPPSKARGMPKGLTTKGPLDYAFRRQQQLASSQEAPGLTPSGSQGSGVLKRRKPFGSNRLQSKAIDFFKPITRQEMQSQVEVNLLESDEDF
jgi:hypothetical protein